MERKTINYTIKYFERGKDKEKRVVIKRISRGVIKDYNMVLSSIAIIEAIERERQKLIQNLGAVIVASKKFSERIKDAEPIKKQLKQLEKQLYDANAEEVFNNSIKIVEQILDDNGIEEKELCSKKFWTKKTEERDLWDFLNAVVYKDIDISKKKA